MIKMEKSLEFTRSEDRAQRFSQTLIRDCFFCTPLYFLQCELPPRNLEHAIVPSPGIPDRYIESTITLSWLGIGKAQSCEVISVSPSWSQGLRAFHVFIGHRGPWIAHLNAVPGPAFRYLSLDGPHLYFSQHKHVLYYFKTMVSEYA